MQYARLGDTGLKVSRLCLGMMTYGDPSWRTWVLPAEEAKPFVKRSLELGINFFDTADMYSLGKSEEALGAALKEYVPKREDVVVASKVYYAMNDKPNGRGLSRKHIMESIDASLKRLGTNYVDLYQIHRWDTETPIEETMEALNDVVRSGKALYIGASSMYAWQFAKAQHIAEARGFTKFVSMQNHYNLIYREEEREMNPLCIDQGVGLIPWSPLARGALTGARKKGEKPSERETIRGKSDAFADTLYPKECDWPVIDRCIELAKKKGLTPAKIALAWILSKKGVVSPIIGCSKMEHLEEAVQSLQITLSTEEIKFLEEAYVTHPILGH